VAQALAEKRPVLLGDLHADLLRQPVLRPVTDMVSGLAKGYANRARFGPHRGLEDFKGQQLNDAAKEWIFARPTRT